MDVATGLSPFLDGASVLGWNVEHESVPRGYVGSSLSKMLLLQVPLERHSPLDRNQVMARALRLKPACTEHQPQATQLLTSLGL